MEIFTPSCRIERCLHCLVHSQHHTFLFWLSSLVFIYYIISPSILLLFISFKASATLFIGLLKSIGGSNCQLPKYNIKRYMVFYVGMSGQSTLNQYKLEPFAIMKETPRRLSQEKILNTTTQKHEHHRDHYCFQVACHSVSERSM